MRKDHSPGRVYGGLKKEERAAQRRQKFIDAGIEIFGTQGYHAATVRSLCEEAGLTVRYFYESFEGTEELFIAVFNQCMQRIRNHITLAMEQADPARDQPQLIDSILDAFFKEMEDKRVARVVMLEVLGVSGSVDRMSSKHLVTLGDLLIGLGHSLYPSCKIGREEGTLLSLSLLGAMRQATIHWMATDYKMERKAVVSTTSLLVFGLLRMLEEQSKQQGD